MSYILDALIQLNENDEWEKRIASLSLEEDFLLEGKNLEKTIQMYLPKFQKTSSVLTDFPETARDVITDLIAKDPTYKKGGNTTGDYATWILDKYLKSGNTDWLNTDFITRLLNDFINVKQALPNKDIGAYKSADELQKAIDNTELSDRQKERRLRKSNDYELVYQDNDWTVYVPTTFAGSCTLGKGTNWCTAYSENDSYYYRYSNEGPLYIIINNHDKSEKYQFHYPSKQYMDKNDQEIDKEAFLNKNKGLLKFFIDLGLQYDSTKPFIYRPSVSSMPEGVTSIIVSDKVITIENREFCYNKGLQSVIIPDSVRSIGYAAFAWCTSLNSVRLSNSIRIIQESTFLGCTKLQAIDIPNSVLSIWDRAFEGCKSLTSIVIPNSVQFIGDEVFADCTALSSLTMSNSVKTISSYAFDNCFSLESIVLPSSLKDLKVYIFGDGKYLKQVVVKKNSIAHEYMQEYYPEIPLVFKDV